MVCFWLSWLRRIRSTRCRLSVSDWIFRSTFYPTLSFVLMGTLQFWNSIYSPRTSALKKYIELNKLHLPESLVCLLYVVLVQGITHTHTLHPKTGFESWWRHQMETNFALLAICEGNSQVTGEFPAQMPVTRSFDVFFDLCLNKRLSKQWWGWWFEPPSRPLWRHCNDEYLSYPFRYELH